MGPSFYFFLQSVFYTLGQQKRANLWSSQQQNHTQKTLDIPKEHNITLFGRETMTKNFSSDGPLNHLPKSHTPPPLPWLGGMEGREIVQMVHPPYPLLLRHPPHGNKMVEQFDANLTQRAKYCLPIRYDVTECDLLEAKRERILKQFGTIPTTQTCVVEPEPLFLAHRLPIQLWPNI